MLTLRESDVEPFTEVLGDGFYKDVESIRQAVRRRGSFNVIHLVAMLKVDYMRRWAAPLGVSELLGRAWREATS